MSDGTYNTHASIIASEVDSFTFRDQIHNGKATVSIVRDPESNDPCAPPNGISRFSQQSFSPQHPTLRVSDGGGSENTVAGFHNERKYPPLLSISRSSDDSQTVDTSVGTSSGRASTIDAMEYYESCKKDLDAVKRSTAALPNDTHACLGTEWVKQHEPGVYITFTSLPSGGKDLKRVRFRSVSRRHPLSFCFAPFLILQLIYR
jgi:hypothetical protein